MSLAAMTWATDARRTGHMTPSARLILTILAMGAEEDGSGAMSTASSLALRTGLPMSTIGSSIADLVKSEHLLPGDQSMADHIPANRRPKVYTLNVASRQWVADGVTMPARTDLRMWVRERRPMVWSRPEMRDVEDLYSGGRMTDRRASVFISSGRPVFFVYTLFRGPMTVYVGITSNAFDRFHEHARRHWWTSVDHLEIQRVTGTDVADARRRALRIESILIAELRPAQNVRGVPS